MFLLFDVFDVAIARMLSWTVCFSVPLPARYQGQAADTVKSDAFMLTIVRHGQLPLAETVSTDTTCFDVERADSRRGSRWALHSALVIGRRGKLS